MFEGRKYISRFKRLLSDTNVTHHEAHVKALTHDTRKNLESHTDGKPLKTDWLDWLTWQESAKRCNDVLTEIYNVYSIALTFLWMVVMYLSSWNCLKYITSVVISNHVLTNMSYGLFSLWIKHSVDATKLAISALVSNFIACISIYLVFLLSKKKTCCCT